MKNSCFNWPSRGVRFVASDPKMETQNPACGSFALSPRRCPANLNVDFRAVGLSAEARKWKPELALAGRFSCRTEPAPQALPVRFTQRQQGLMDNGLLT
ncbi:hypothetical protein [Spirosoma areae]